MRFDWQRENPLCCEIFGGIGSAIVGAAAGLGGTLLQNRAQASQAQNAMGFSERAYKRRYQWQMADMRKAGLNPILSYSTGAPGGPQGVQARMENLGTAAVSSAAELSRNRADVKMIREQAKQAKSQAGLNDNLSLKAFFDASKAVEEAATAKDVRALKRLELDAAAKYGIGNLGKSMTSFSRLFELLKRKDAGAARSRRDVHTEELKRFLGQHFKREFERFGTED